MRGMMVLGPSNPDQSTRQLSSMLSGISRVLSEERQRKIGCGREEEGGIGISENDAMI